MGKVKAARMQLGTPLASIDTFVDDLRKAHMVKYKPHKPFNKELATSKAEKAAAHKARILSEDARLLPPPTTKAERRKIYAKNRRAASKVNADIKALDRAVDSRFEMLSKRVSALEQYMNITTERLDKLDKRTPMHVLSNDAAKELYELTNELAAITNRMEKLRTKTG